MVTLRCTQKLRDALRLPKSLKAPPPTTKLGDWYAHYLHLRPQHLIIAVSDRSLLTVLLPVRTLDTLTPRFRQAVREVLEEIGAPAVAIEAELREMDQLAFGPTASRRVLGSLNDFVQMLEFDLNYTPDKILLERVAIMNNAPCKPIDMRRPIDVALELLTTKPQ